MDVWLLTIASVIAVSAVSLIGIAAFSLHEARLRQALFVLVGLAAGALIGDAVIHLIPESLEALGDESAFGLSVLAGIAALFILEKYLRWHHAHHGAEEEHAGHEQYEAAPYGIDGRAHLAPLVLVADGIHNVLDGAVIAGSFLVSPALGAATTLAVFLHEIPQEIADYALLIHSGLSRARALLFNFLSGLTALVGAGAVLALGSYTESAGGYVAAFTAGAFIYIAAADLLPELNRESDPRRSRLALGAFFVGIGLMFALTLLEAH